jgi:hypothetical protein
VGETIFASAVAASERETGAMQLSRKSFSFWKQDLVALVFVIIYVVLAFAAMWVWTMASEEANAFVSNVERVDVK